MLIPFLAILAAAPANDTLRLLLVTDDTLTRAALVHGAMLGADEAAHSGALFGTTVVLRVVAASDSTSAARAIGDGIAGAPPSLVVAAGSVTGCAALADVARRDSIAVLDAGCELSAGTAAPTSTVFHLGGAPDSTGRDSTRLELWHWTLEKFGGEQLNQRYDRRFHEHMTSAAWEGWLAAKIALDLALHAHAGRGAALLARLRDPHAQFDGQKGRPLHFDAAHRLVQPRYRVAGAGEGEHVVAEVTP